MADKKISALTASTTPLAGTEVLPIVQGGATVKVAVSDLTAGRAISATEATLSTGNLVIGTTAKGITTGSAIPLGLGVNNAVNAITITSGSAVGVGTTSLGGSGKFQVGGGRSYFGTNDSTYCVGIAHNNTRATATEVYYLGVNNSATPDLIFSNSGGIETVRITNSGSVGIGAVVPSSSAIFEVLTTTQGVRMPNMTTAQKNAIVSPVAGLIVFDTTLEKLCVYSGAAWQTVTSI
jgi:hypothetical protein